MKLIALISMLVVTTSAFAQNAAFVSGNKLKTSCDSTETASAGICLGYALGVADATNREYCAPGGERGVTGGQILSVVKKYFSDNPSSLHQDANVLILRSLKEAFPCSRK